VVSEVSELVLPEHEVSESMFRLILLTAREVERSADWALPLCYFAFWTVRLGGWLPRFDRCAMCDALFESQPAFYDPLQAGLFCEKCRRSGMKPLHREARFLAERFTGERLDRIEFEKPMQTSARELREASLAWIEHNIERRLATRTLLEMT
jgi:recombinational DNA repair protein (RecF pathway)